MDIPVSLVGEAYDRRAAIITARASGRSLKDVGAEFGITRERVRQICGTVGKDAYKARCRAKTILGHQRICAYCGKTFAASKPRLGCDIYHTWLAAGGAIPEQKHRDAVAARSAGMTWADISRHIYGHDEDSPGRLGAYSYTMLRRWAERVGYDISWLRVR